jgi:peptide/nickel transport system permease protein
VIAAPAATRPAVDGGTLARRRPVRRGIQASPAAVVALIYLMLLIAAAALAPIVAPYPPNEIRPSIRVQPPSAEHWLGTDEFGRDLLSRVIHGGQLSLRVAAIAVIISTLVGVPLGLVAGFYGRVVDDVIMRFTDILLAFPGILLALGIVSVLRPGLTSVIVAVGISGIPHFVRVARGSTLSARADQYVEAARVSGCSDTRIIWRHILPNILAPIIVLATLGLGTAILSAAALSFLGLGQQPPTPEWGNMMNAGRDLLRQAPWITNSPGLAIMTTVLAVNTLGDALRDALDPRLRRA